MWSDMLKSRAGLEPVNRRNNLSDVNPILIKPKKFGSVSEAIPSNSVHVISRVPNNIFAIPTESVRQDQRWFIDLTKSKQAGIA